MVPVPPYVPKPQLFGVTREHKRRGPQSTHTGTGSLPKLDTEAAPCALAGEELQAC